MSDKQYILLLSDYDRETLDTWTETLSEYGVDWHSYAGRAAVFCAADHDREIAINMIHRLGVPCSTSPCLECEGEGELPCYAPHNCAGRHACVRCGGSGQKAASWLWMTPDGRLLNDPGVYQKGDPVAPTSTLQGLRASSRLLGRPDEELYSSDLWTG